MPLVGGLTPVDPAENSLEVEQQARFAVDEYNNQNPGANLRFKKVVSAKTQPVAGTMYYLDIEAESDENGSKVYSAKVWTKAWENWKKLETFEPKAEAAESATVHHADDPVVMEAAEHALKGLQQRSNSLIPYELQHVVEAQAKGACLELLLKVKRGQQEEHVKAEVNRSDTGHWTLHSAHLI